MRPCRLDGCRAAVTCGRRTINQRQHGHFKHAVVSGGSLTKRAGSDDMFAPAAVTHGSRRPAFDFAAWVDTGSPPVMSR